MCGHALTSSWSYPHAAAVAGCVLQPNHIHWWRYPPVSKPPGKMLPLLSLLGFQLRYFQSTLHALNALHYMFVLSSTSCCDPHSVPVHLGCNSKLMSVKAQVREASEGMLYIHTMHLRSLRIVHVACTPAHSKKAIFGVCTRQRKYHVIFFKVGTDAKKQCKLLLYLQVCWLLKIFSATKAWWNLLFQAIICKSRMQYCQLQTGP